VRFSLLVTFEGYLAGSVCSFARCQRAMLFPLPSDCCSDRQPIATFHHYNVSALQFSDRGGWAGCSVWVAPGGLPAPGMLLGCNVLMQGGGTARLLTYLFPWRPGCLCCKPKLLPNLTSGDVRSLGESETPGWWECAYDPTRKWCVRRSSSSRDGRASWPPSLAVHQASGFTPRPSQSGRFPAAAATERGHGASAPAGRRRWES
jgi:hypothetical protein